MLPISNGIFLCRHRQHCITGLYIFLLLLFGDSFFLFLLAWCWCSPWCCDTASMIKVDFYNFSRIDSIAPPSSAIPFLPLQYKTILMWSFLFPWYTLVVTKVLFFSDIQSDQSYCTCHKFWHQREIVSKSATPKREDMWRDLMCDVLRACVSVMHVSRSSKLHRNRQCSVEHLSLILVQVLVRPMILLSEAMWRFHNWSFDSDVHCTKSHKP